MAEHWFEKWSPAGLAFTRYSTIDRIRLMTLVAGLLSTVFLAAQPKAFASLQPDRIETGDTSGLILLVSGLNTAPGEVDFSPWSEVMPLANIIGRTEWRRSGAQWTRRFTLIAFDSANLQLPPLKVRISTGEPLLTNALTLLVFPTRAGREISDMARIRDIRREPASWMDDWPLIAGLFLVSLLLVWWLRKSRKKPAPLVQELNLAPPSLSPAELAMQKLGALQQKQLWKQAQTKEHYAELSLILREYLETQYRIAALESTTPEIMQLLAGSSLSPSQLKELKELLQKTDLVKYAQSQPPNETHEAVLVKASALIQPLPPIKTAPTIPKSGKYEPL